MKKKVRFEAKVNGWYFPNIPNLFWHSGSFWIGEEMCKIVFKNGSRSVLVGNTKYGLKKIRTQAQPCEITILNSCPF
jgi:hypothetical protein